MYKSLLLLFLLAGCASTQQITTEAPLYKYRANMQISVDGVDFDGMGVTAIGVKDIGIVSQAALDLLRITTCHRDFTVEKVDKGWFGGSGHQYVYHYEPTEKERSGMCPIYFQAFSKDRVTDWGYLAFRSTETLPGHIDCNGVPTKFAGISVCQTKAGLDQILTFDRDVKFAADANCKITQQTPRKYSVRGNMGFCYAEFSDGNIWHRLILLGYDTVLVRGG